MTDAAILFNQSDLDLASKLRMQLMQCYGYDGDEIATQRSLAMDYYFQRPLDGDDKLVGRAQVVSGDVSSMVEATLAQMMEAFSSDRICDFDPLGPEDEDQAQLESEAVQWFVMGQENGFLQLMSAIKEALLVRNGLIMIDAIDRKQRVTRRLGNVEPAALAALIAPAEVIDHEYDEDTKELMLTIESETREFRMQSVSMENFIYDSTWYAPTLEGIPLCAVRHIDSRAELVSLGCDEDKVAALTEYRNNLKIESFSRNPQNAQAKNRRGIDASQELVEYYEVFIRMDAGGGVDQLHRILFSNIDAIILKNEPIPFMRLAAGTAILNAHRFTGISLYDKLKQNQDIRTALRRALLDNVNATTKNRLAGIDGMVNQDDATDPRVNNMLRVKNMGMPVGHAVMPLVVPDTSANILANLESTARERSEMGGAALDLQTAQTQIGGDRMGSMGLDRAYSVSEQLTASMLKTISSTLLRSVFLLAHKTLREYFDQPVPIKRDGKWSYVTPSSWPERHSVTVKPGMSPGERTRKAGALGQVLDAQMMLADRGMDEVLVDLHGFNRSLMDWARLMEVQNPEQYFIDPESDQSMAALEAKNARAEELETQKKALMQQSFGLEQLRIGFEKYRHDSELMFKYFAELLGVEVEEAKIAGQAQIDFEKARYESDRAADSGKATAKQPDTSRATGEPAGAAD